MPQGAAISSDGSTLAVVESGFNPPALALYATPSLRLLKRISLTGAFGRPVWTDHGILVAGANADALFVVDPKSGHVRKIALPKNSYPIAVAARNGIVAVATDGDGAVRIGRLDALRRGAGRSRWISARQARFFKRRHDSYSWRCARRVTSPRWTRAPSPCGVFPPISIRATCSSSETDSTSRRPTPIRSASTTRKAGERLADVFVGTMPHTIGSSPNALAAQGGSVFVSLGAANEIAVLATVA